MAQYHAAYQEQVEEVLRLVGIIMWKSMSGGFRLAMAISFAFSDDSISIIRNGLITSVRSSVPTVLNSNRNS